MAPPKAWELVCLRVEKAKCLGRERGVIARPLMICQVPVGLEEYSTDSSTTTVGATGMLGMSMPMTNNGW